MPATSIRTVNWTVTFVVGGTGYRPDLSRADRCRALGREAQPRPRPVPKWRKDPFSDPFPWQTLGMKVEVGTKIWFAGRPESPPTHIFILKGLQPTKCLYFEGDDVGLSGCRTRVGVLYPRTSGYDREPDGFQPVRLRAPSQ